MRFQGADTTFQHFVADKLDALAGLRPRLVTDQDNLPGLAHPRWQLHRGPASGWYPKGAPAGAEYLCAFIEDIKATGLVARTIAKNNVRGLTVAPKA